MSPISRKPIAPAKQNAQQDKAEAQAQARQTQDQAQAAAQAAKIQAQAQARAEAKRAALETPTAGGTPQLSPADKARMAVEAAKKATANTPKSMESVELANKAEDRKAMESAELAKQKAQLDMAATQPSRPGMGTSAPVVPRPGMPRPGMPRPGMPRPGMPRPGMPSPGMPSPGYTGMAPQNMTTPKAPTAAMAMRRGGAVRSKPQAKFASGGSIGGASRRGDGIAQRGKTKGRMC